MFNNDQEELLQFAIIDLEFREELSKNPEAFGMSEGDTALPKAVAGQSRSPAELIKGGTGGGCNSTCYTGFTVYCDGGTSPIATSTCNFGITISCDTAESKVSLSSDVNFNSQ
ncbi:MAG: cinnamycin family lantibiotic [Moorea sp. SIO4G2]|uniref:cinnamycin family lantibiotic n=1 Tax=unclassified Moorena TaxID=2683338 RepID=UPI0013FBB3FE|nr:MULTISPECIES: cinnamycin family lantibiotic [unclassified Moorena]NEO17274.1 cinnamycin family lantibiotic [Moorena sp. SIO3E8]NEO59424.1 cinnamycin family lantibiotic [Moorena sp. SIO4G2]NEQ03816.1 cinnamycin family lantibiotic [Moorena sp. SIO3F7]